MQHAEKRSITIGWGITDSESTENWDCFIGHLSEAGLGDLFQRKDLTVLSDRLKGLAGMVKRRMNTLSTSSVLFISSRTFSDG